MIILALVFVGSVLFTSCGGSHKSSRSGGGAGGGGGTGSGTGTGTGTGGNGTGTGTGGGGTGAAADKVWNANALVQAKQTAAGMEAYADHLKTCNIGLYKSTEGQGMLGDLILRSGVSRTDEKIIFMPKGYGCGTSYPGSHLEVDSGDPLEHVFLHEWGHFALGVHLEEYSCSICNMANNAPGRLNRHFCDTNDCIANGKCWDNCILPSFSGWTHTGADPGNPPDINITIEN